MLLASLSQPVASLGGWGLLACGLLLILLLSATRRIKALEKQVRTLKHEIIPEATDRLSFSEPGARLVGAQLHELTGRVLELEERVARSKQNLGLVRFDAFEDVSGEQSFALALYDDNGNGVVICTLVGRRESRIYCKPIRGGKSDWSLSEEEERAIREARPTSDRPVVLS
jgi:hypothetical protein